MGKLNKRSEFFYYDGTFFYFGRAVSPLQAELKSKLGQY